MDNLNPCECGCGSLVKHRFVSGHNIKHDPPSKRPGVAEKLRKPPKPQIKCQCNCGELAKPGNKFIVGHNNRGIKLNLSKEKRQNIIDRTKKMWKDPVKKQQLIQNIKKSKNTPEGKEKSSKAGKEGNKKLKQMRIDDQDFSNRMIKEARDGANKLWEEKRDHMMEVRKTQWTPQARHNMSLSTIERMSHPEEREKLSKSLLKVLGTREWREAQSIRITNAYIDGKLNFETGKFKTGYIQTETCGEIFYQSSYEERFIYILEHFFKRNWKRNCIKFNYFDGKIFRNYIPDYTTNELFFEVKGWFSEKDKFKVIESSKRHNLTIYLIFEKELKFLENLMSKNITEFPFNEIPIIRNGVKNEQRIRRF